MIEIVLNSDDRDLIAALPTIINKGIANDRNTIERFLRKDRIHPIWWDGEFAGMWRIK